MDELVSSRRGEIAILAPRRLERETCECYFIINSEFDRLLQGKGSSRLMRKIRKSVSERDGKDERTLTKAHPPPRSD